MNETGGNRRLNGRLIGRLVKRIPGFRSRPARIALIALVAITTWEGCGRVVGAAEHATRWIYNRLDTRSELREFLVHTRAELLIDNLKPAEFAAIRTALRNHGYEWENQGTTTIFVRPGVRLDAFTMLSMRGLIPERLQGQLHPVNVHPGDITGFDKSIGNHKSIQQQAQWNVERLRFIRSAIVRFSYPSADFVHEPGRTLVIIEPRAGLEINAEHARWIKERVMVYRLSNQAGTFILMDRNGKRYAVGDKRTIASIDMHGFSP